MPKLKTKDKEVLASYIEAKIQLDVLTKEVSEKKAEVVKIIQATEDQKALVGDHTVTLRRYAKYTYSDKVNLREDKLKADKEIVTLLKNDEELDGAAELVSETFTPLVK